MCLFLACRGSNLCNLLKLNPFVSSQGLIYASWTRYVMTFDSRSFIKPAVNSRHLYWASALSVEVVITLSTWLNQSNVLYRNFIGAVSFIVANWLFGCFENEQVLYIYECTSILHKYFPANNWNCFSVITCCLGRASKKFPCRDVVSLHQLLIVVVGECGKCYSKNPFTFLF